MPWLFLYLVDEPSCLGASFWNESPLWLLGMGLSWLRNTAIRKAGATCRVLGHWIGWAQPVDGYLPVGGSGDTGMLKEGALGELWQNLFHRSCSHNKSNRDYHGLWRNVTLY